MSILRPTPRHFDAGCTHEVAHQALARAFEDFGHEEMVVGISGAGCGALVHAYLDLPFLASPFGRGPSVARGLLLARPEALPMLYLGDGELLGEGLADLLRAAQQDDPMLVILIDNSGQEHPVLSMLEGVFEIRSTEAESLVEAFSNALDRVRSHRHFTLVWVRGSCPAQGREA